MDLLFFTDPSGLEYNFILFTFAIIEIRKGCITVSITNRFLRDNYTYKWRNNSGNFSKPNHGFKRL